MKILMVNHTLGFPMGTEQMIDQLGKELVPSDIKVLTDTNAVSLYLRARRYMSWADVVCVFNFPATLCAFPFCSKPLIWFCYDIPEEYTRKWTEPFEALNRHIMRQPNRYIIVISELQANRFQRIYNRQADYVVPLGVDYNYFSQGTRIIHNSPFNILHVGAVGKFKNQLDSVSIFKKFSEIVPSSTLTFVGPSMNVGSGPEYWKSVENAIKENGLQRKVILVGGVPRSTLRDLYYWADALLHPISESTGTITLFEALSTSIPVVTSKQFVRGEFVKDFCVVTEDYLGALFDVYSNRVKYNEMARRGSEWVGQNLTSRIYARKISSILEEVLSFDKTHKRWWMRETKNL